MTATEFKSIKVKPATYNKLVEQASWNESMDDVISSLLAKRGAKN